MAKLKSGTTIGGSTAWHASNDGTGSGLDADLLDGQQGSYYTSYTDTAIANLVASAPSTLDTLNELAAALGDDPNFATTVTNSIATKASSGITISAGTDLSGGGDLTANRTISHAAVTRTNNTSTASPAHGGTFTAIDSITTSATGHITAVNTKTITLPADNNTTYGAATSTVYGLVKLEDDTVQSVAANAVSATASRTYGIQVNSSGQMVVNVPWVDTNTTYGVATTSANGLMSSTDKSKLDGIEAGATADQTAAEILTAITTVDGTGSGLDADLLDGVQGASYLRSDATDTFTTLTGTSMGASYLGVNNTTGTNGYGLSLYNGAVAGQPTYGIMFQQTGTFGTHGSVTGDWATYFTMNNTANRGWVFRQMTTGVNVASINNAGTAVFNGDVTAYSDERLKDNIVTIDNAVEKVSALRGITYTRKSNGEASTGLIAQDVQAVLPEAVNADSDGMLSVKYGNMVGLLIEAIKEQNETIKGMQAEIAELTARLNN
jgi:hypothetical protein